MGKQQTRSNSGGNGNKGGRDQGPPDLDDIFRKLSKNSVVLGAVKAPVPAAVAHRKAHVRNWEAVLSPSPRRQ